MKQVIIVGSAGQDGRILFDRMRREACRVHGIDRHFAESTETPGLGLIDILDSAAVERAIEATTPDEVYYLAAFHQSAEEKVDGTLGVIQRSHAVNVLGLLHFLEAMRRKSPRTRLFYAASARIFGMPERAPQDETTPLHPDCVYSINKAAAVQYVRYYRQAHSLFAVSGILYNHESPLRPPHFVSQKIVRAAAAVKLGIQSRLVLGDLDAVVDWGYAPDFVDAMIRMLNLPQPEDFVVATGEPHSVREFVEIAFGSQGLDWTRHVDVDPTLVSPRRRMLVGDASRLRRATGWNPSLSFAEMIALLVGTEVCRRETV